MKPMLNFLHCVSFPLLPMCFICIFNDFGILFETPKTLRQWSELSEQTGKRLTLAPLITSSKLQTNLRKNFKMFKQNIVKTFIKFFVTFCCWGFKHNKYICYY